MRLPNNFETAYEAAIQLEALAKPETHVSTALAAHVTSSADWRSKFEKRLERIEMVMKQLANEQLKQYQTQTSHSVHWHPNNIPLQYDGADDWEDYGYDEELQDACEPDLEHEEQSTCNHQWDYCYDNNSY